MRNQILFTKYSNERSEKFAIRTQIILDENHKKYIVKHPMTDKAVEHVRKMLKWEKDLNQIYVGTGLSMNRCSEWVNGIRFEYLGGKTLESELDAYLEKKDVEGCIKRIGEFVAVVRKAKNQSGFHMTEEFREVFGEVDLSAELMCSPVTDIDMVFGNVMIVDDDTMQLIDYEWTFEFPIPISFIIFRAIHYYTQLGNCRPLLYSVDLYKKFGISKNEVMQYEKMEENFQRYIIGSMTPIRHLYEKVSPGCVPISRVVSDYRQRKGRRNLQIFWNTGNGYSEKDSVKFPHLENGEFDVNFIVPERTIEIRLDPGEDCGVLHIEKLQLNDENVMFSADGWIQDDKTVIYSEDDPKLFVCNSVKESVMLRFKGYIDHTSKECAHQLIIALQEGVCKEEKVIKLEKEVERLSWNIGEIKAENNRLNAKMTEMENTKVWKMYQKIETHLRKGN